MQNYYYPEVVHFYAECNKCLSMKINKTISINNVEIYIDKIHVSILPFNQLSNTLWME